MTGGADLTPKQWLTRSDPSRMDPLRTRNRAARPLVASNTAWKRDLRINSSLQYVRTSPWTPRRVSSVCKRPASFATSSRVDGRVARATFPCSDLEPDKSERLVEVVLQSAEAPRVVDVATWLHRVGDESDQTVRRPVALLAGSASRSNSAAPLPVGGSIIPITRCRPAGQIPHTS